jgi:hypothetical protein
MHRPRSVSAVGLLAFAAPLLLGACAPAGHLGQPLAQHVVLHSAVGDTGCSFGAAGRTFRQVFQDGTGALQPFEMPAGRDLVVTDLDWWYHHPDEAEAAGRRIVLRVMAQNLADPDRQERMVESTIMLNAEGEGGTTMTMTTGFVMAATAQLCFDTVGGPAGPPSGVQHLILRGYFLPAG